MAALDWREGVSGEALRRAVNELLQGEGEGWMEQSAPASLLPHALSNSSFPNLEETKNEEVLLEE